MVKRSGEQKDKNPNPGKKVWNHRIRTPIPRHKNITIAKA